jgi:hypothetical protein
LKDSRQGTLCSRSYKNISIKQLQDKFLSIANEYYILLDIVGECDNHCLTRFKQKIGDVNHQPTEDRMDYDYYQNTSK